MNYELDFKLMELLNENDLRLERCKGNDLDEILSLYSERKEWFKQNSIDQWDKYLEHHPKEEFIDEIKKEYFFTLKRSNEVVAAFELSTNSKFWNDDTQNAYYIYKIVTKVGSKHLGNIIIDICKYITKQNHKKYLRLDCLSANQKLNQIYENYGFKLIKKGKKDYYSYSLREYIIK